MAFHGSSGSSVGRSYIDFVASHDCRQERPLDHLPLVHRASFALSEYCRQVSVGNTHAARLSHNAATRELRHHAQNSSAARFALITAGLIDYRNRGPLAETRTVLRGEVLHQISLEQQRTRRGGKAAENAYALLAEHGILATLLRDNDERFLTQPALPHHEQSDLYAASRHFDLVATIAGSGKPLNAKLQVKLRCLGWCDDPAPAAEVAQFETRSEYDHDIKLVSGCCDLGMRDLGNGAYDSSLFADLAYDDSPAPSLRLAKVAYGLLHIIAEGEDRCGFIDGLRPAQAAA